MNVGFITGLALGHLFFKRDAAPGVREGVYYRPGEAPDPEAHARLIAQQRLEDEARERALAADPSLFELEIDHPPPDDP